MRIVRTSFFFGPIVALLAAGGGASAEPAPPRPTRIAAQELFFISASGPGAVDHMAESTLEGGKLTLSLHLLPGQGAVGGQPAGTSMVVVRIVVPEAKATPLLLQQLSSCVTIFTSRRQTVSVGMKFGQTWVDAQMLHASIQHYEIDLGMVSLDQLTCR